MGWSFNINIQLHGIALIDFPVAGNLITPVLRLGKQKYVKHIQHGKIHTSEWISHLLLLEITCSILLITGTQLFLKTCQLYTNPYTETHINHVDLHFSPQKMNSRHLHDPSPYASHLHRYVVQRYQSSLGVKPRMEKKSHVRVERMYDTYYCTFVVFTVTKWCDDERKGYLQYMTIPCIFWCHHTVYSSCLSITITKCHHQQEVSLEQFPSAMDLTG